MFTERELTDDYPVFTGYLYVVDGEPRNSPIKGNVGDLKRALRADTVTSCDVVGRNLWDRIVK